jgi:TolB-like protein
MTEALTSEMGKIHGLRVPSRTSVMLYKREKKPLQQIARELSVDALVEGSVVFCSRVDSASMCGSD